jgi:uridine phosphorylase
MLPQYHLQLVPGDVAPYVLLPGDPGRVPIVALLWDEARKVAENREYVTYTGVYQGAPISCTSTGIGAPSTSIAMEELARVGATTFIRIGTCGSFQDHVRSGDMAIFDSAVRDDGSSAQYAPPEFPAVAHHEVVRACIEAGEALGYRIHVGTTRSSSAFYVPRPGSSFGNFWQSRWRERFEDFKRLNVIAAEMEAAIIFVLARVWGLRAGGLSVVIDNVFGWEGESGGFDPARTLTHTRADVERLARMGCETVRILHERDRQKSRHDTDRRGSRPNP